MITIPGGFAIAGSVLLIIAAFNTIPSDGMLQAAGDRLTSVLTKEELAPAQREMAALERNARRQRRIGSVLWILGLICLLAAIVLQNS